MDGAKLKYFSTKKGKTLGAMAQELGINQSTLTRKMNGESDFTRKEILRIKNYLKLEVSEMEDIFFNN